MHPDIPFKRITDMDYLVSTTSAPPRNHFSSVLGNRGELSEEKHKIFRDVWNDLKIDNMLTLFSLYLRFFFLLLFLFCEDVCKKEN